jgi:hypothetical protein
MRLLRHRIHRFLRLATRLQHGVREHAYQAHIAAAVHQTDIPTHEFRTQFLGGIAVSGRFPALDPQKTQIRFMQLF